MLVGRASERDRIDALLDAANRGASGILVLRGEAGIGKTVLLRYAREQAAGFRCLRVHGVETEAELAFAGLTELLRPVRDELARLPPPQAEALHRALAHRAEPASPLAVRAALLSLLADLAEARPLLVTVDDAQWVDESSMEALAFAARRLAAESVVLVATIRGDAPIVLAPRADAALDAELTVTGLDDADARRLLDGRNGLSGPAAEHLLRVASGNPLALLELPDIVGTVPAEGVEPPPVGPRVQQAFEDRLTRLPESARLAVAVAAAGGVAGVGEILAAFATLGLDADALLPAEREGLVSIAGNRIRLRHPLLRSAAYHLLDPPDRRRVHAALAAALSRPSDVERRTWHRAAAALGPDEDIALALDDAARAAERRGALATTAHGFARAAGLSADDDDRARRLLAGADAWLAAGHWDLALEQLDQARPYAFDARLRADIAASTGQLECYRAGPEKGAQILVEAADAVELEDPERATRLLTYAVNVAVFALDIDEACALADRAVTCGERAGGLNVVAGTLARVEAGLLAADPAVPSTLEPLAHLAEALIESDLPDAEHVFSLVVLADLVLESWDRAEFLLDVMVRRARDTGRLFLLAVALAIRADIAWRRGRWNEAYVTATNEAWETPLGLPGVGSWLHAVQARIEAGLGLSDDAETHGREALAAATETGTFAAVAWAGAALGFLELGRDRPQAAIEHLERVEATCERGGVREPGILWWAADLIEAYWRVGDIGAARRRLETLRGQAEATGRSWAQAAVARGAGILAANPQEADDAFAAALLAHARLDAPFERARTLLARGERRREFGRGDADEPLRESLATFDRIGATPWAARARRLLGDEQTAPQSMSLTRQERQVAAIVGRGATNREAAEQLFLSPRTIDFHLRNIYKKLQVRSRTELAVHIAAQEPAG